MADILREGFETDGSGTRYTLVGTQQTDGSGDFFTVTDGSNIGSFVEYSGQVGDFYFAAMDTDADGNLGDVSLTFENIDISGYTDLTFSGLFAEDDDGNTNQDWDADTSVYVEYSIDGGAYQTLLAFEATGGTNTEPGEDTNFDGLADGTLLSDTFQNFTKAIGATGSSLNLRISLDNLNAGDEDIAFDEIAITGTFAPSTDLYISEYIEGSSNNKAIEIYNGTGVDIDLAAGGYAISYFFNGNTTANTNIALTGTLAAGDVWVLADVDSDQAILDEADQTSSSGFFNGDDAVALTKNGTAIDVIGQIGTDPGSEWSANGVGTQNETLRRVSTVTEGDADGSDVFDPSIEFESFAQDSFDDLGQHNGGAPVETPTLSIADVTITEGDSGTSTATFTVTLSADVDGGLSVDYATADDTATTADSDYAAASGTLTFTGTAGETQTISVVINGDETTEGDESFTVALSDGGGLNGAEISATEGTATGTITNDDIGTTLISTIQGAGSESGLVGQVVTVEAIVVGDFQDGDADTTRNLNGFFLQEEDADADGNANTSEGIFVFDSTFGTDVNIGDRVQVTGTVAEYFGETQLSNITAVTVLDSGNTAPTAATISLPAAATSTNQGGDVVPDLEAYEGMLVSFEDTLTVNEMFQLDRFNEITLVQGDRPYQFSQQNAPDAAGYAAHLQEVGARTITYDDGQNFQNTDIANLDGLGDPFTTANALSMGDTIENLTGVLSYQWAGNASSGATWRVRSTEDGENVFEDTNTREDTPADVGGEVKVASFNVLNYFTTIDETGATTLNGNDPRGADTVEEFDRQTEKLVTAISAMDADVIGLIEMENDFGIGNSGNAIANLVAELNAAGGTWDWVDPGVTHVGSDAIANGFIYNTSTIELMAGTTVEVLDDSDLAALGITPLGNGIFDGVSTNRAVVAASFTQISTGEGFTATVNHFKSKGSVNDTSAGNTDAGDGAGNNNSIRLEASIALDAWLATDPTNSGDDDVLILGDLNAYALEDPITYLLGQGYHDLAQEFIGSDAYGYVFDGQVGTLDYAMASASLFDRVTGVTEWHINSDEADAIDYNTDFGRDTAIFDGTEPYRASDHDPVIVGLNLTDAPLVGVDGINLAVDSFSDRQDAGDASSSGFELTLTDNAWKTVDLEYTITENTVVTFDFKSDAEGEVHGIGFANGEGVIREHYFKLSGTQNFGWSSDEWSYETGTGFETISIRVGDYLQGDFDKFVFVMDDDAGLGGDSTFRNVQFAEDESLRSIEIDGEVLQVGSFDVRQDMGDFEVSDSDGSLTLTDNAWKFVENDHTITADTVLTFEFKADVEGEIHGIGFANDDKALKDNVFNLAGTQSWGLNDAEWDYTVGSDYQSVSIRVGDHFTGDFDQLVFVMDDDAGLGGDSSFRNISITDVFDVT